MDKNIKEEVHQRNYLKNENNKKYDMDLKIQEVILNREIKSVNNLIKSIVKYKSAEYEIKMSECKDEFVLTEINKKIIRQYIDLEIEVGVELGIDLGIELELQIELGKQVKEVEIVIHMLSKGLDEEIISELTKTDLAKIKKIRATYLS